MTSRGCTKSYSRKISNGINSGSIQFDKLFRENSSRPSAAKSAGIVGKWGITSFTSIRSTNVNGKHSNDIRGNYGTKRMKLDYGNQNDQEKDAFCFDKNDEITSVNINKPKKFFKSRNMVPIIGEESCSDLSASQSVTKDQGEKTWIREQHCTNIKQDEKNDNLMTEISKEEGKPPIVLRICKGTARLVCSEDTDSESYRNSIHSSKINVERNDISESTKWDSGTSSIFANDESETRTTRSRAKNLRCDVNSSSSTLRNSQTSSLSLTLRKSTDSSNARTSHYDIVKTENNSSCSDKADENLINNKLLPSTQELIDILSSDVTSSQSKIPAATKDFENQLKTNSNETNSCKNVQISMPNNLVINLATTTSPYERKICGEVEQQIKDTLLIKNDAPVIIKETKDLGKSSDPDWFSSSEDSESASGNLQNEIQHESQGLSSNIEQSSALSTNIIDKPTVVKKGSIFKTRSTGVTSGNKRRALYKHKWCDSDKESKICNADADRISAPSTSSMKIDSSVVDFEEFENSSPTRVTTYQETKIDLSDDLDSAVTSVRCDKKIKEFYTVVKNVKKAHQIQESGEFQEFNDDVEYILDTLRENNPNATRCLSAIRLASKCMAPAFRMHVRAHGTVAKFFKALHDATTDQSLALCTATVMFVLSQDRLAMDLDRDCLELMLSLLESDASHKNALNDCGLSYTELLKNKEKVRQLCADIQAQGHAKHLNLDNITVGQLAMETLLSLTSKRAGEWFKEEIRELGGLQHIIKTVTDCHRHINSTSISVIEWNEPLLDKLRKVDRCLRVLENVTHMNEENQVYLLEYNNSILVTTLASLYTLCSQEILKYPTVDSSDKSSIGAVIRECLFAVVKVLINLTHRFNGKSFGGKTVGFQSRVIDNSLHIILRVSQSIPDDKRFDVTMLALILLINLIEQCDDNKKLLVTSKSSLLSGDEENGLSALINLFYKQEELARAEEQKTDAILDGKKDSEQAETISTTSKSREEFIEETVTKLLQKAGRHMEHTLIGAYVVLLLGYLMMDNDEYENLVRNQLPDRTYVTMIAILQKFFNFMNLTASNESSSCGIAATEKVINFLKLCDSKINEENTSNSENIIMNNSLL